MTTTTTPITPTTPQFSTAGLFLEKLTLGEFDQLAAALEPDVTLDALLPRGFVQWEGSDAVCGAFDTFFGNLDRYEMVDATVGQVGERLQLRWRLQVGGGRLGPGDYVVEQHCYADTGPTGRIRSLALVCSGFCQEHVVGGGS